MDKPTKSIDQSEVAGHALRFKNAKDDETGVEVEGHGYRHAVPEPDEPETEGHGLRGWAKQGDEAGVEVEGHSAKYGAKDDETGDEVEAHGLRGNI